jgi:hypothetical protein
VPTYWLKYYRKQAKIMNKEKPSNIVSLAYKREEAASEQRKADKYKNHSEFEMRVAELERKLDLITNVLMDTVDLAENNRDYLMKLLRKLQDHQII